MRDRVLAAVDEGRRVREVAPAFRVSVSYVCKALERRAGSGDVTAHRGGGCRPPKLAAQEAALLTYLKGHKDATLAELRRWLLGSRGVAVSVGWLWNTLDRLGWTLEKSRSGQRSRTAPTSPRRAPPGMRPSPA